MVAYHDEILKTKCFALYYVSWFNLNVYYVFIGLHKQLGNIEVKASG